MRYLSVFILFLTIALSCQASDVTASFPILKDASSAGIVPDSIAIGTSATSKNGMLSFGWKDSTGNASLPTTQANGSQVAADVGVNVAGVQVDPRQDGITQSSAPSVKSNTAATQITVDEYGRLPYQEATSAEWGKMFTVSSDSASLSGTTETAFLYFQNPNASGKTVKFYRFIFGPTLGNNYVTYKVYKNPTVTSNGTAKTPVGNRQSSQASTVVNVFTIPTVTSNGTFITTFINSGLTGVSKEIPLNFSLWLEQNNSILITRTLSSNATIGGVDIEWVEE